MKTAFFSAPPRWLAPLGFCLTLLAIPMALQLQLSSELLDLLPAGSKAARDYRAYLERFGGGEKVFVLVLPSNLDEAHDEAPDEAQAAFLATAATRLASALAQQPEIAAVRAGLEPDDERFFLEHVVPRAPLLLLGGQEPFERVATLESLERQLEPAAIEQRVARLRSVLRTPAGAVDAVLARRDPLGFSERLEVLRTPVEIPLDPLTSTFRSRDGAAALLILTPARAEIDPAAGHAIQAAIDQAAGEVLPDLEHPIQVRAVGGALYAAQDEAALRRDLSRTLTGSIVASAVILFLAFGGPRLPLIALTVVVVGLLWTAAALQLLRVELAAVAVGFGAVLVGLGVDYGIHACARFQAGRNEGLDAPGAIAATVRHAGPAILTSALTTAAAFLVLRQAHLPPLRQLGILVALGCLCILIAMLVLGSWQLKHVASQSAVDVGGGWRGLERWAHWAPSVGARHPWPTLAVAILLTMISLWGVSHLRLEPDPRSLRPENRASRQTEELLVRQFDVGLGTASVVVRGDDSSDALRRAHEVAGELRAQLGDEIAITGPTGYLLGAERVEQALQQLRQLPFARAAVDLEQALLAEGLDPRAFEVGLSALRAFADGRDPAPPTTETWPGWLRETIFEETGFEEAGVEETGGTWIALALRLPEDREIDVPEDVGLASVTALGQELQALAARDLRRLALLALAVVSILVLLSFRGRFGLSLLTLTPVVLGALWTLGLWTATGHSLDLFSLAVLPILLGIGLDDGLHVVHGMRSNASLRHSAVEAGPGLWLTTATTCAGFGSLVLSTIPGLRAGGLLIASGVVACWLCTVVLLPALEAIRGDRAP